MAEAAGLSGDAGDAGLAEAAGLSGEAGEAGETGVVDEAVLAGVAGGGAFGFMVLVLESETALQATTRRASAIRNRCFVFTSRCIFSAFRLRA